MQKKILFGAAMCAIVAFLASPAVLADDVFPPPWRGQFSTTSQVWEFNYDPDPNAPDPLYERFYPPDFPAPGGNDPLPSTLATVFPSPPNWLPDDPLHGSNRVGIWSLSGSIDVIVDNHDPPNIFKWVWVQLTWAEEFIGDGSVPAIGDLFPEADPRYPVTLIDEFPHGDGWLTSTYEWRIFPNPEFEEFTIGFEQGGGILVDQLVVDTWCTIPEPPMLGLLVMGFAGILVSRRRLL